MTAEQIERIRNTPLVIVLSRLSTALPNAAMVTHLDRAPQ
jgi:hypothetical protein